MDQEFWDQRFRESHYAYGTQPNDFLRAKAAALPPGDALCLAEGGGRNAVHLAQQGHRVTAQDLSPIGLEKAQQLAQKKGVTLLCSCGDLRDFTPEAESVDLVVAIWMHLEPELRALVHRRAADALKPGGHLILEAYNPGQLQHGTGGPPNPELLITAAQLQEELQGLTWLELQETERWIEEGPLHQGQSAVVQAFGQKQAT
ncbi:class I SAM-dependent methyltransferase [Synechococcus sp. W4D4]|jgi:SAM-dependent methyltransferase|uniref:class I SAM-dependent methyltransferase n=1 Tax=Synechococcus sp. W4D4 TaxID=3392294 RepID=UPI0039E9CB05